MTATVARSHRPSIEEFTARWLIPGEPVVLTGIVPDWRAHDLWGLEPFRQRLAGTVLTVNSAATAEWRYDTHRVGHIDMPSFLDDLANHFAVQVPVLPQAPWVLDDIELPPYFPEEELLGLNFWLQGAGAVTHLHWDGTPGLLALVRGEKRLHLYAPEQHPFLYPAPRAGGTEVNWSEVDVLRPNPTRFPEFGRAEPRVVTLRAGEVLFIPRHVWHHVHTTEVSIGVNFWWRSAHGDQTAFYEERLGRR